MCAESISVQGKKSSIIRGVRRPQWAICSNTRQIVILVRDKSSSMNGKKAVDASAASQDLVAELALPDNKGGFNAAVVDFSSDAEVVCELQKATALDGKIPPLSPNSCTNLTAGLEKAHSILEQAGKNEEEGMTYLRPVVIAFTDGCHNSGPNPHSISQKLKEKADIVTVAFGSDADEKLLQSIASTAQHFYRCSSGRELRIFLAKVGKTITQTYAASINASEALSMLEE